MKSYSLREIPDELWVLLLETLPRTLTIDNGIQRLFEQRVVRYFDGETHVRQVFRGALEEDDPNLDDIVSYYQELVEKHTDTGS
jgi:hypothetical protein